VFKADRRPGIRVHPLSVDILECQVLPILGHVDQAPGRRDATLAFHVDEGGAPGPAYLRGTFQSRERFFFRNLKAKQEQGVGWPVDAEVWPSAL
jgi:hypothetical protein